MLLFFHMLKQREATVRTLKWLERRISKAFPTRKWQTCDVMHMLITLIYLSHTINVKANGHIVQINVCSYYVPPEKLTGRAG